MKTGSKRGRVAFDLAICAALMAFGVSVTTRSDVVGAGTSVDTLLLPTVILPIVLRHRAPLAASAALAAGCVVSGIPTFDQFRLGVAIPAAMLILYSLARDSDLRRALAGLALVLGGMVFIGFTDIVLHDEGGVIGMVLFSFPLCLTMWGGGRFVRSRDQLAGQLTERSGMLERQRERTAELAVEVERAQLASALDSAARDRMREIIALAERGEEAPLAGDDGTRDAFARIERLGRESLNEMRGLLGVLRSDERGTRSPRPTLAQIETLLAEARRGGRLVDLDVEGERRPLPGGVELAAYRVVQHALLAIGGDGDEPAIVQLRYTPTALELEVCGSRTRAGGADAALMAARERVTAHGGSFSTDNGALGRCVLRARLPTAATNG